MTAPVGVGTYCDVVKSGVNVEWKGMAMANKEDYSKQVSFKPKPVKKGKKATGKQVQLQKQPRPGSGRTWVRQDQEGFGGDGINGKFV